MSKLRLTQELAERFAAALCAVIRADKEIGTREGVAVQETMRALFPDIRVDMAEALFLGSSPETLSKAVLAANSSPYRGPSVSSPSAIAKAFELAATRVAGADGNPSDHEYHIIQRYVDALTKR